MKFNDAARKNTGTQGSIVICRADEAAARAKGENVAAVLSIEHPGVKPGERGAAPRLDGPPQMVLTFWDSEEDVEDAPDAKQVARGMGFVLRHLARGDVIIHCNAGKARSAALALGVLALLHPQKSAEELVAQLLDIRPQAAPNIRVVGIADALAQRGGKLTQAVLADGKIAAARAAAEEGRKNWRRLHPEKFPAKRRNAP
ncbi:MAG: hypothetical protein KGL10_08020 [Alphaproteobacteria bacterium]|nr:hypothetical protein [Alphaproteobacteria bacterium]